MMTCKTSPNQMDRKYNPIRIISALGCWPNKKPDRFVYPLLAAEARHLTTLSKPTTEHETVAGTIRFHDWWRRRESNPIRPFSLSGDDARL
jgi:hypothetical protein